jgi:uncharacterized coiled-coil DUF342 family protein
MFSVQNARIWSARLPPPACVLLYVPAREAQSWRGFSHVSQREFVDATDCDALRPRISELDAKREQLDQEQTALVAAVAEARRSRDALLASLQQHKEELAVRLAHTARAYKVY